MSDGDRTAGTLMAAFVGLLLAAVVGWYVAPLAVGVAVGVLAGRVWVHRRAEDAEGDARRRIGRVAIAAVLVLVAVVLVPSTGWLTSYDHRLRAYSPSAARHARSQAHRRARRHHRPYRAPSTVLGRLEPWRYHASAGLTAEVVARMLLAALGVSVSVAAAGAYRSERSRVRGRRDTTAPEPGVVATRAPGDRQEAPDVAAAAAAASARAGRTRT